jgi:tRNA pseudouridine65 synthase
LNNIALDILYEDEDIIAVNKPAGLLTHPSWLTAKGTENLASMLKEYLNGAVVHTVHRLDRATSGVIVVAKNKLAAQHLSQDFAEHNIEKTYLCVVRGYAPEVGHIDHALKYKHDKKAEPFANTDKEAQIAVTDFKRLACVELPISVGKWPSARYSLLQAKPQTGRKHQLRRHFKHILCPIVGDTNYGEGRHNILFREHFAINRLLLMATSIEFKHPISNQLISIQAPLSIQVSDLFHRFGWEEFI